MIEKALRYLTEKLAAANLHDIENNIYSDKPLHRITHIPKAAAIEMNTLSSLVDYIKSDFDERVKVFVHVKSPTKVEVYSVLDPDREREYLVEVNAQLPSFRFNDFMNHEEFCINLQSKFIDSPDRALLLKFAGTVEAGSVAQYGDDGITQKATVKVGVASKGDAIVPNPVALSAYRTFIEVEQPCAQYIFRMKQNSAGGVMCGLFEADGGAWKLEAMEAVRMYLEEHLKDVKGLIVIS